MSFHPADAFEPEWVSECCGAPAYVGAQPDPEDRTRATGICSRCKDHASFVKSESDD